MAKPGLARISKLDRLDVLTRIERLFLQPKPEKAEKSFQPVQPKSRPNFPDITLLLHVYLTCRQETFDISLSDFISPALRANQGGERGGGRWEGGVIVILNRLVCCFINKAHSHLPWLGVLRWPFNVVTQFSASVKIGENVPKEYYSVSALCVKSLPEAIHLIQEQFTLR